MLRALASSRGVRRHGRALVCGRRLVEEVTARHPERVEALVYSASSPPVADDRLARRSPELLVLPLSLLREIDPVGVEPPLAVVRVDPLPRWQPSPADPALTLLLPLGDPENLGAALRSAAAFGVGRVVLLEEAAHPFHPRAIRAAAATSFGLDLAAGPPISDLVASPPAGVDLLVLDREGEPIDTVGPGRRRALLVGEEGQGVPVARGLRRVTIPTAPGVESLNAAVAVGIALWELTRH